MTGYVIRHGCFYHNQTASDHIDQVLITCMGFKKKKYKGILEVKEDFRHCRSNLIHYLKSPIVHIVLFVIYGVCTIVFHMYFQNWKEDQYHVLLREKNYEEAIRLFPQRLTAYQEAYDYTCTYTVEKDECKQTMLLLEEIIASYHVQMKSDIKRFYAMKCMSLDDPLFYQKADKAFSYVKPLSDTDKEILQFYRTAAQIRGNIQVLNEEDKQSLFIYFQTLPAIMKQQSDRKKVCEDLLLFIQLYEIFIQDMEEHDLQQILDIIAYLQKSDSENIVLLNQIWVNVMHQFALSAYHRGDIKAMHQRIQTMKNQHNNLLYMNDTMHRQYVFLYVLDFTNGISDKDKKASLFLLEEAMKESNKIKDKQENDKKIFIMIEKLQKEWG